MSASTPPRAGGSPSRARRRSRRSRRWFLRIVVVAASAALLLALGASAAQLAVSARDRSTDTQAPCTISTLPTTHAGTMTAGLYSQVRVSSIPAACNNLSVSVVVYGTGGVQLATGTGNTGTTGTAAIPTSSYRGVSATGVALLVDTWGVRTTWTAPPYYTCIATNSTWVPISPAVNCTLTNVTVTLGTHNGYQTATMSFRVANLSGYTRFVLTIDFAANPPFPGWTPVRLMRDNLREDPAYTCTQLPFVSVRGRTSDGPTYYFYETLNPVSYNPGGYNRICPL